MLEVKTTTVLTSAEALERQLRQVGFLPGVPRHIDEATRGIDARICRQTKCPGCRRRRMVYRPFTDGRRYRVLACCQHCPTAEEV